MFLFIDFCQVGWLPIILSFPLGLLLGWLLWGRMKNELEELREETSRYRRRVQEQESEIHTSSQHIAHLESQQSSSFGQSGVELDTSRQRITELEGELALAKGKILEIESGGELDLARKRITALEGELMLAQGNQSQLNDDSQIGVTGGTMESSRSRITELEGELALAKGKIMEIESGDELNLARKRITALEGDLMLVQGKVMKDSEDSELAASRRRITELEGQLALAQGEIRNVTSNLNVDGSKKVKVKSGKKSSKSTKKDDSKSEKKRKSKKDTDSKAKTKSTSGKSAVKSKPIKIKTTKVKAKPAKYAALKTDNLQIIEGIGPKMNQILVDNGIVDWHSLADKTKKDLENILGQFGDRYKIIDPSDWPTQAAYASQYDFNGLVAYQKKDGSDSKAEKLFVKLKITKKFKLNDFKAIEGIGPKISGLLEKAGIKTWKQLSDTPVSKIQEILASAGKRYQLADPTTWPQQAALAAEGKFDELGDLQGKLSGGKTK